MWLCYVMYNLVTRNTVLAVHSSERHSCCPTHDSLQGAVLSSKGNVLPGLDAPCDRFITMSTVHQPDWTSITSKGVNAQVSDADCLWLAASHHDMRVFLDRSWLTWEGRVACVAAAPMEAPWWCRQANKSITSQGRTPPCQTHIIVLFISFEEREWMLIPDEYTHHIKETNSW